MAAIVAAGPVSAVVGKSMPTWTAFIGSEPPPSPTIRLIQPVRAEEPGAASSTSSIAEKCDRLTTGSPVAWMAASSPDCQYLASGCIDGCSPNIESLQISEAAGTAVVGRAW